MPLSQFQCPHCHSPFQVDLMSPTAQATCPHCQQAVALTSEPPVIKPPVTEPPVTEPPVTEPPVTEPPLPITAPTSRSSIRDDFKARQYAADERATRKFVKNMIVWVCCAIVMIVILAYFLR